MKVKKEEKTHKLVCLLTVAEQGPFILLLMLHKSLRNILMMMVVVVGTVMNAVTMMMKLMATMTWISTLKPSLEGHSADWVASSHFSKRRARRGKRGCL